MPASEVKIDTPIFEVLDALPCAALDQLIGGGGLIVLAPHPDDETLGCGGLIAEACLQGRKIKVVIVSDGALSHPNSTRYPLNRIIEIRRREAVAALRTLGLDERDLCLLNVRDGAVPSTGAESVAISRQILEMAQSIDASAIAVTWRNDRHEDHRACYAIGRRVLHWKPAIKLLEYAIWGDTGAADWRIEGGIDGYRLDISRHVAVKRRAIAEYRSQVSDMIDDDVSAKPLPSELIDRSLRPYEAFIDVPHQTSRHQITAHVHQIMLTDDAAENPRVPQFVAENAAELRALYPSAQYRLWNAHSLREFISEHFGSDVLQAFDQLRPHAYKADLARYCLLYVYGGLYVDLAIRSLKPLDIPHGIGLASFRDYDFISASWTAIACGIIWAVPGRREFRIAIDYIVENCRTRYYGSNPLYPTGPVLLGRALVAAMAEKQQRDDADDQWIGICRAITPDASRKNITYISPDQTAVAFLAKDIGGDLSHMGVVGGNNYNLLWRKKIVYGESVCVWTFDDPAILLTAAARRTGTGIAARADADGFLTYGPYIQMEPGTYRLSVLFDRRFVPPRMIIDACHDAGTKLIHAHLIPAGGAPCSGHVDFTFEIAESLRDAEFRIQAFGEMAAEIRQYSLERVRAPSAHAPLGALQPADHAPQEYLVEAQLTLRGDLLEQRRADLHDRHGA